MRKLIPIALTNPRMLLPFVEAFQARGGDHWQLMEEVNLTNDDFSLDMVPAKKLWEYIERASQILEDKQFGFGIGFNTPSPSLENLRILAPEDQTLGERLSKLVVDAGRLTNQATYTLSHDAQSATIRQRRHFQPRSLPTQSDGFFSGFIIKLFQESVGPHWNPADVRIRLCSQQSIPLHVLPRNSLVDGGRKGMLFRFPARWLLFGDNGKHDRNQPVGPRNSFDLLVAMRREIDTQISNPSLTITDVAQVYSFSVRALQLALEARGTNFSAELRGQRMKKAKALLQTSGYKIGEVGAEIGLPIQASFTRAFKSWTQMTPSEFRASVRANV